MTPETPGEGAAPAAPSPSSLTRPTSQAPAALPAARRPGLSPRVAGTVCALALAVAGVSIGRQTPAFRDWWYSRQPLPALLTQLKQGGENPQLLYHIGLSLNEERRFAEADGYLRQGVGLDPESARLRDEWARALLGSGQTQAAFGELQQFAGTHPNVAAAHRILGKFYFTQKSLLRAREELETATRLDPQSAEAWAYLSQAQSGLGKAADALPAAQRAAALRPQDGGYRLMLATLLADTEQTEVARAEFERAVALAPTVAVAHHKYAEWLLGSTRAEDRARCVEEARQAVALEPNDADFQLVLGRALIAQEQLEAAVAPLERASELDSRGAASALALAQAYNRLGKAAEARRWQGIYLERQDYLKRRRELQEAVGNHPDDPAPKLRLARFLGMHGEVEEAAHHYAMARHLALDAPPVLVATANDLIEGGHPDLALPLARRAVEATRSNPDAHVVYGNALLGLGQYQQAIEQYNKALLSDPARLPVLQARLEKFARAHPQESIRIVQVVRTAPEVGGAPAPGVQVGAEVAGNTPKLP